MLKNQIADQIREHLGYEPTESQEKIIPQISEFVLFSTGLEVLMIKGYAGTGKTTLINALVRTFNQYRQRYVLMAPTGRAAKVLSSYTGQQALTIHKKIYRQKSASEGMGLFVLDRNLLRDTCFIVDEASMIANSSEDKNHFGSGRLLEDLLEYVYSMDGCRLILIGDTAQLPPVGLDNSPALDESVLEDHDFTVKTVFLDDVVRQSLDSGILMNATRLRLLMAEDRRELPGFNIDNYPDISRISGADLIEELGDAYNKYGQSEVIIVTRSNKRANKYNLGIRNQILFREEEITVGDLLMVVRNNYYWVADNEEMDFIANGDIGEIVRIHKYEDLYDLRFADVTLSFRDYGNLELRVKIILDTLQIEKASFGAEENRELYYRILEDFPDVKSKKKKYELVKENPFFNALQVKFAYAVTCHKAQGGQWQTVFIDQGYLGEDMINREYYRWLYTALTRASKKLYLVNFADKYFMN